MGTEVAIFPDERQLTQLRQIDWDLASGNPKFIGTAEPGSLDTDPVWFIRKLTWDVAGNPVKVEPFYNVQWSDRGSL